MLRVGQHPLGSLVHNSALCVNVCPQQIAVEQGCDAVHPGYGFLSENEAFCAAITAAGIQWLGPDSTTMHNFSLKHVARELASNAGVRSFWLT